MSVRKAPRIWNMLIFGANVHAIRELAKRDSIEENMIVEHKAGMESVIQDDNGMYKDFDRKCEDFNGKVFEK